MGNNLPELPALRSDYRTGEGLGVQQLASSWLEQFARWLSEAVAADLPEPNAMTLATADAVGRPSARTVLLKGVDADGFVCFTNLRSRKASEAQANPYASLVFRWLELHRQVVVCGAVQVVSPQQAQDYFAQRPRAAQLGAWASPQSQVVSSREQLAAAYAAADARFVEQVPMPSHWGGLRVVPHTVEFWQGRTQRLHDRLQYRRQVDGPWVVERLAP